MRTSGSFSPYKTNERVGRRGVETHGTPTRAQARYVRMSATKVRAVLDLIRGETVQRAGEILQYTERDAAEVVGKCLASAVANAVNNDGETVGELFVLACYADEGPTLKRWRPRARGRATRIRKRTTHVTVLVARLPEDRLAIVRAREGARSTARSGRTTRTAAESRRRRVARSRGETAADTTPADTTPTDETSRDETSTDETSPTASAETSSGAAAERGEGAVEEAFVDGPYGAGSVAPPPDDSVPSGYEIKGNADSMLYHEPGTRFYDATKAEVYFASAEDAERAGFSLPPSARDAAADDEADDDAADAADDEGTADDKDEEA